MVADKAAESIPPTAWCKKTSILEMTLLSELTKSQKLQGGACWIWGTTDISRLKYKHPLLRFFPPHWMTCKEDVELAADQCALEMAVGNEVHRALSRVCFPNECRRVNAQQLLKQEQHK